MADSRTAISLPTYTLGAEGKSSHFTADITREAAAEEAKSLEVGDAAFILRSDHKWAYSILTEKSDARSILRFEVDGEKNRKTFPQAVWGKYIRIIKVDDAEMVKLQEEAAATAAAAKKAEVEEASKKETEVKAKEVAAVEEKKVTEEKSTPLANAAIAWVRISSGASSIFAKKPEVENEDAPKKEADAIPEEDAKAEEGANAEETEKEVSKKEKSTPAKNAVDWEGIASGVTSMFSSFANDLSNKIESLKKEESKPAAQNDVDKTQEIKDTEAASSEPTSAPMESREDTEEKSAPAASAPELEPEPTMAMKLLQTPIKFFKAATMQEDPAEAALAATSFADEPMANVVICEKDPSSAKRAKALEWERMYGPLESQGITIVETERAEVKKEGVLVVEAE